MSLLVVSSLCAFEAGTINAGGSLGFASYKSNSDDDATTTLYFSPQVGYFFIDNLSADLLLSYWNEKQGDDTSTSFALGIGARYFYNRFYGGLGFMMESWGDDNYSESANHLELKAGYLLPLVENVFVDLGLKYKMGIGEYGSDGSGDNEESQLGLNVGFQIFFPTK